MFYKLYLKHRNKAYAGNRRKSEASPVPTICIGNVTVGGTGKTPHTEMVLRFMEDMDCFRGKSLAVLSRGYKRKSKGYLEVVADGNASDFGDEPLQIKRNFPNVSVAVDVNRLEGCRRLVEEKNAEYIVLDDAFQYRKLRADLNIVLMDSTRPVWKDRLLPFGRLRDLPERIYDADCIIVTKCHPETDDDEKAGIAESLGLKCYNPQDGSAYTPDLRKILLLFSTIRYCAPVLVFPDGEPRYIYSKKTILFSGIANPAPLLAHLGDITRVVDSIRFPDHHGYSGKDVHKILELSAKNPISNLMTTQKDAQKFYGMDNLPAEFREKLFMVPIRSEFCSQNEEDVFRSFLSSVSKEPTLF